MAALLLLMAAGAAAQTGPARVIDGDTLQVAGVRVRLWGIDAPESRQTCGADGRDYGCGERATRHLRTLVAGRTASCEPRTRDRYGRTVALCRTDGSDLGAAMVRDGWAVAFVRYAADYVAEERDARAARRGLWQGAFTQPWEWRRMAAEAGGRGRRYVMWPPMFRRLGMSPPLVVTQDGVPFDDRRPRLDEGRSP